MNNPVYLLVTYWRYNVLSGGQTRISELYVRFLGNKTAWDYEAEQKARVSDATVKLKISSYSPPNVIRASAHPGDSSVLRNLQIF
jgi:hypothetical protein